MNSNGEKNEMNPYERKNLVLTIINTVLTISLSATALVFSILSYNRDIRNDSQGEIDNLIITNSGCEYNDILHYKMAGGYRGQGLIQSMDYTVFITNMSNHDISIINCDICREVSGISYTYDNITGLIKDQDGAPVELPFNISANDSLPLTFEINYLIPPSINMLLMDKYGVENEFTVEDVEKYLGENRRDLFGNVVDYYEYYDGSYSISIDNPQYPEYSLSLTTARGEIEKTILSQLAQ